MCCQRCCDPNNATRPASPATVSLRGSSDGTGPLLPEPPTAPGNGACHDHHAKVMRRGAQSMGPLQRAKGLQEIDPVVRSAVLAGAAAEEHQLRVQRVVYIR